MVNIKRDLGYADEALISLCCWTLAGILTFLALERAFQATEDSSEGSGQNKKVVGYLNLLANCVDNFLHGLAVARCVASIPFS